MIGYKFIKKNMKSNSGNHKWVIGKWYKKENIKLCETGFHACKKPLESLNYNDDKWFIVEARGKIIYEKGDKFVAQEMRLIKEIDINILKHFAVYCAESCLKYYEKEYPDDKRISEVIEGTKLYLDKKITLYKFKKLISAAWSARSAAWSAVQSARSARSAQNKKLKRLINESK